MDFKTTTLAAKVECDKIAIGDFPALKFGALPNGQVVFDATRYFEENEIEPIDHRTFGRICRCFINALATRLELNIGELFFINTDGHTLMNRELAILFLQFANPDVCVYFNSMLWEMVESGIAISDAMVANLTATRVPNEVLQEIIDYRNENESEQTG